MLTELFSNFSYLGIGLVLLFSGFMPFPEDVLLLTAGYLCAIGEAQYPIMAPLCVVGVIMGDFVLFWLGHRYGHHVPRIPLLRRIFSEKRLARAERAFNSHGGKAMILARFLPGLRAPTFFTAGVFRVLWWKFIVYYGCAAMVTVPIVVWLGKWGAEELDLAKELAREIHYMILAALVAGVLIFVGLNRLRVKRRERRILQKRAQRLAEHRRKTDEAMADDETVRRAR